MECVYECFIIVLLFKMCIHVRIPLDSLEYFIRKIKYYTQNKIKIKHHIVISNFILLYMFAVWGDCSLLSEFREKVASLSFEVIGDLQVDSFKFLKSWLSQGILLMLFLLLVLLLLLLPSYQCSWSKHFLIP